MASFLQGIIPPVVTPFEADGRLDLTGFESNIESYSACDFSSILVLGSNGEAACLSEDEKVAIIKAAVSKSNGRPIYAGTGTDSTRTTVDLTKKVADAGASAALVLNPFFFKSQLNGEALRRHYEAVADDSPIPVLLYSMPGATGLAIPPGVVHQLAKHPNIRGMKDSSGDIANLQRILAGVPKDFPLAAGSAPILYSALALGASGGVLAVAGCAPEATIAVYRAFEAGDHDKARRLQIALTPLAVAVTGTYGVAGLKAAVTLSGRQGGVPRPPLAPATESELAEIKRLMDATTAAAS
ncbi:MAG: dihydrodipicolinate synthase family protein [Vicinamibacteria bacterium]|nr:dihydrodipicolinate synthase family protein [Vicinamibacteria bacterium]